jgi:hypothetical protein
MERKKNKNKNKIAKNDLGQWNKPDKLMVGIVEKCV